MIHDLLHALATAFKSQIFGGGIALGIVGTIVAMARNVPARALGFVRRRLTVTVDVPSGTRAFDALQVWLDRHPYSRRAKALTASDAPEARDPAGYSDVPQPVGSGPKKVLLTPAPGRHLLWLHGRPLWLAKERKDVTGSDGRYGGYRETITFTVLGRSQAAARKLLDEAQELIAPGQPEVRIFATIHGDWYPVASGVMRGLDTVVLPQGMAERIVATLDRFFASREWYEERGIRWALGFLFEGEPGTGKTSLIKALAGHFRMDLYHAGIASRGMTDEGLMALLNRIPPRSALLLEDVDRVVKAEDIRGDVGGVTFSGLLNALDGVASRPGLVTFMTTNNPDALDPALIRQGRVDVRREFPLADAEQAARLFLHFYAKPELRELAETFGARVVGWSPAAIQGLLMEHRDDPSGALSAVHSRLAESPVPL